MEPSHLVKVVAAFVAGVVVALGSALIYVRVSDMVHPQAATQNAAMQPPQPTQLPDAGQDTPEQTVATPPAPADDQRPRPEPVGRAIKQKPVAESRHQLVVKPAPRREPIRRNTEIAQNRPPAYAPPAYSRPSPTPQAVVTPPTPAPIPTPKPVTVAKSEPPMDPPAPNGNEDQHAPAEETPQLQPAVQDAMQTPPPVPVRQPHVVTLPSGTNVVIRLGETLSTDHNYTGDTFRGALESQIIMDGFVIADRGSKVLGRIANAQRAGRIQGTSDLTLTLAEINTTDGQRVRIDSTSYEKRGPVSTGRDGAEIAGGAALGAIIGAAAGGGKGAAIGVGVGAAAGTGAVLATRAKPAVLPIETRLTFRLATPVTITEKLNY